MLISLEIENFKGIAGRQRITFTPLSLLFGANSAGKSTILQALAYLHEIIERGNADVDHTELCGSLLDLGGFNRLVHEHDFDRAIVLRAEFATLSSIELFDRDLFRFPFPDLDDQIESAWLELTVRYRTSTTFRGAFVERTVLGVNGMPEPLVWLETAPSLEDALLARINLRHPLIAEEAVEIADRWAAVAVPESVIGAVLERNTGDPAPLSPGESGSPVFEVSHVRKSALPSYREALQVFPLHDENLDEDSETCLQVRAFLEMVVLGTAAQLASYLKKALYVGPLRAVPPRGFLHERPSRITSWFDGLAAWDSLLADRLDLIEETNRWLRKLNAGCRIAVQQLFDRGATAEEISVDHVDKTERRLLLDTGKGALVLPSEVGAGVSQMIPVIVAALNRHAGLVMMEQPELHVHPAIQVGLGDLFIEAVAANSGRRSFMIETHSEHLILRLLRRIRETTDKELPDGVPPFGPDKLSVIYVENTPDGVQIRQLRVDERGEFLDRWPKGFFEERAGELF